MKIQVSKTTLCMCTLFFFYVEMTRVARKSSKNCTNENFYALRSYNVILVFLFFSVRHALFFNTRKFFPLKSQFNRLTPFFFIDDSKSPHPFYVFFFLRKNLYTPFIRTIPNTIIYIKRTWYFYLFF